MLKFRITFISDTHTKHNQLSLPGGDILIHAGDLMNSGYYKEEIRSFCKWCQGQDYDEIVFIAGNHDRFFEDEPEETERILEEFPLVDYLRDSFILIVSGTEDTDASLKIYGSPWQPEFYNWAFNLPRNGEELKEKWSKIPDDVDILITHGPPQGILDTSGPPYNEPLLGCELLMERVKEVKPKIHVFGHIHGGYGYRFYDGTHFINAAVLNERYVHTNKPVTIDFYPFTNTIEFID